MQRCIAALASIGSDAALHCGACRRKEKTPRKRIPWRFFVCMFRDLAGALMRSEYTLGGGIATGVLRVEVIFKNALIRSCVENL
jgi:hypothetical protein